MKTEAYLALNAAGRAVYDKLESRIHTFEAPLAALTARAESAKADAELTLASLATAKRTLDQKVVELKKSAEPALQQVKADVEARIEAFEKWVASESTIKAA